MSDAGQQPEEHGTEVNAPQPVALPTCDDNTLPEPELVVSPGEAEHPPPLSLPRHLLRTSMQSDPGDAESADMNGARSIYSAPCSPVRSPKVAFGRIRDVQAYAKEVLEENRRMENQHVGLEYKIWEARQRRQQRTPNIQVSRSTPISLVSTVRDIYQVSEADKKSWRGQFSELDPNEVSHSDRQVERAQQQSQRTAQLLMREELARKKAEAGQKAAREQQQAAQLAAKQAAAAAKEASIQAAVKQSKERWREEAASRHSARSERSDALMTHLRGQRQQQLRDKHDSLELRSRSAAERRAEKEYEESVRHWQDYHLHSTRRQQRKGKEPFEAAAAARMAAQKEREAEVRSRFASNEVAYKEYQDARREMKMREVDTRYMQVHQRIAASAECRAVSSRERFSRAQQHAGQLEQQRQAKVQGLVDSLRQGMSRVDLMRQAQKQQQRQVQDRCREAIIRQYWARELEGVAAATKKLPNVRPDVEAVVNSDPGVVTVQ